MPERTLIQQVSEWDLSASMIMTQSSCSRGWNTVLSVPTGSSETKATAGAAAIVTRPHSGHVPGLAVMRMETIP